MNSSLAKIDEQRLSEEKLLQADKIIARDQIAAEEAAMGPGRQDYNTYLAEAIKTESLQPQEAMQALNSPEVAPEIKAYLQDLLMSGGGESLQPQQAPQPGLGQF